MLKLRKLLLAGGAAAAVAPLAPALAQSGPAQPDEEAAKDEAVDTIVVTAERFGSGLSRGAFTLGKADIDERPLGAEITQSLVKIPGVQVSTGDSRGGSFSFEIYMRGLTDEQIGLTLDGIPTGDSRFNGGSPPMRFIEPANIGRINVSQSAGDIGAPSRFALGGFIDFVTDNPADAFGVTVEGGYGSFDFWRGFTRIDTGEIWPGFRAYVSASTQEYDVWAGPNSRDASRQHFEFKGVQDFDNGSRIAARVSFNDQEDNDFNIVTLNEFNADPDSDRATDAISGIPAVDANFGGALGGVREDLLAYFNVDLKLAENAWFEINPYYQSLDGESFRYQDRARDLTGPDPRAVTGYNANGGAIRPAVITARNSNVVGGPADMRVTPRDRQRYGVTSEFRIEDLFERHTLRIGGWWEGGDSTENRNFFRIADPATSIAFDRSALNYVEYERSATIETTMVYAQDQVRLFDDRVTLNIGATWMDVSYDAVSPLEYNARVKFSQDSGINPKIGAVWRVVDGLELFGGYAQNFSGIPEDAFLGSTAVISPNDLKPVETRVFDLGVRYVTDDLALSIQTYSTDLKNNVAIVPRDTTIPPEPDEVVRGNVATRAANIEGAKAFGVEMTGFADLGAIDLYGAYSYQDAEHENPAPASVARRNLASVAVIGGASVRDIPRHSLFGQIGWDPFPGVRLAGNVRYVGKRVGGHIVLPGTFQEIGVEDLEAYTLVGLAAQVSPFASGPLGGVTLQVNADNLFDEDYIASVSGATAAQPEFGASLANPSGRTLDRYFLGAPRTVTVSVRAKF
jgi:outer membrane cobalamin receptor